MSVYLYTSRPADGFTPCLGGETDAYSKFGVRQVSVKPGQNITFTLPYVTGRWNISQTVNRKSFYCGVLDRTQAWSKWPFQGNTFTWTVGNFSVAQDFVSQSGFQSADNVGDSIMWSMVSAVGEYGGLGGVYMSDNYTIVAASSAATEKSPLSSFALALLLGLVLSIAVSGLASY